MVKPPPDNPPSKKSDKNFSWMVSGVSVYGHLAPLLLCSWRGGRLWQKLLTFRDWEAEGARAYVDWLPPPSSFIPSGPPPDWMVPRTFRVGLAPRFAVPHVNHLWKHSHSHTHKYTLLISASVDIIKLTIKTKCHNNLGFLASTFKTEMPREEK